MNHYINRLDTRIISGFYKHPPFPIGIKKTGFKTENRIFENSLSTMNSEMYLEIDQVYAIFEIIIMYFINIKKQAEAEVVPSSSSVKVKLI